MEEAAGEEEEVGGRGGLRLTRLNTKSFHKNHHLPSS